jgi:hypothetical protein
MEIKKEIYPGVYEITRPEGSKIITGEGWATHIHEGVDWYNIKIEKIGESFKGFKDFNCLVDKYLPDWMKK